jgi:hypothetical protein
MTTPSASTSRPAPKVEVFYFDGCPSHEALMPRLERMMAEAGLDPETVELRHVDSDEIAQASGFLGSPSVRVDGIDVEPGADERADFGMKCRLYEFDGQRQCTPPDAWLHAALSGAR